MYVRFLVFYFLLLQFSQWEQEIEFTIPHFIHVYTFSDLFKDIVFEFLVLQRSQ